MSVAPQLPLALTCGDPAGVGPEIIAAWLKANPAESAHVVPIGPQRWLDSLGIKGVAIGSADFSIIPGQPSIDGAMVALEALEAAAAGCRDGKFSAAVTGPVSKSWMQKAGFTFPGQTEFFAARWGGEPTMAFAGGKLRVVLATWHIPLMDVATALDEACLARAVLRAARLARALGSDNPRIGVCGLNPHAGEAGLLGTEERDFLDPWLDKLRQKLPALSRCEPGDTVFWRALRGEFDVVVALYHDQGLAPLKTVDFDESVNITLGLPWVRTSPDHGTAFTIAGQGKAHWKSFGNAVALARKLSVKSDFERVLQTDEEDIICKYQSERVKREIVDEQKSVDYFEGFSMVITAIIIIVFIILFWPLIRYFFAMLNYGPGP